MRVLCLSSQLSQSDKKVTNSPITIQVSHCQWLNKIQLVEMRSTEVPILQTSAPSRREWRDDASGRKKKAKKRKGKKKEKNNPRQEVVRMRRQKHRDKSRISTVSSCPSQIAKFQSIRNYQIDNHIFVPRTRDRVSKMAPLLSFVV